MPKLPSLSPLQSLGAHTLGGTLLGAGAGAHVAGEGNRAEGALAGALVGGLTGGATGGMHNKFMKQVGRHGDTVAKNLRALDRIPPERAAGIRSALEKAQAAKNVATAKALGTTAAGVGAVGLGSGLAGGITGSARDVMNTPMPGPRPNYAPQVSSPDPYYQYGSKWAADRYGVTFI